MKNSKNETGVGIAQRINRIGVKFTAVVAPVPRLIARCWLALFGLALALCTMSSSAQTNSFPDTTVLYTQPASGFNSALTWSIGATAVLIVVGWIIKAMRKK